MTSPFELGLQTPNTGPAWLKEWFFEYLDLWLLNNNNSSLPIRPSETLPNQEINPTLLLLDYTSLGGTTELSLSLEPISYTNTYPDTEISAEIPPQNSVQGATTTRRGGRCYGTKKERMLRTKTT
ncbi:hypothetical protein ACRALDRAFT_1069547 [Sodiomyces alcalophilus JCM 7366]|uniref:uncharacterized protein n=1 Tax=Sodiomyces alcalophilus JCM 7366 TaxID=591952 RepID=UPI0039B38871